MNQKHTGEEAASDASDVLTDGRTSDKSKSAAASALSQVGEDGRNKSTGEQAASAAADVLRDSSTGEKSKRAAGGALSQAED